MIIQNYVVCMASCYIQQLAYLEELCFMQPYMYSQLATLLLYVIMIVNISAFCLQLQSTPLHAAAQNNHVEVVDILLSHKAVVDHKNAVSSVDYLLRGLHIASYIVTQMLVSYSIDNFLHMQYDLLNIHLPFTSIGTQLATTNNEASVPLK